MTLHSIVAFGVAAIFLATVASVFGRAFWVLDLATHFVLQYAIGAAVLAAAAAFLRMPRLACAAAALALLHGGRVAVVHVGPSVPRDGAGPVTRLLVANVRGSNDDFPRFAQLVRDVDPDIVLAMEVRPRLEDEMRAFRELFPHSVVESRDGNFGIGAWSRLPLARADVVTFGRDGFPSITLELAGRERPLRVFFTHPPPPMGAGSTRSRDEQLREIANLIAKFNGRVVLAGDLNATPWSPIFRETLEIGGLRDSRRGFGVHPTWIASMPWMLRIPIDHVLVSGDVEVVDRRVSAPFGSDHRAVIVELR